MIGTHLSTLRRVFADSLRLRVLMLTLAAFVAVSVPAGFAFVWMVDATVVKLGTLFAEKQVLYDRYRGLEALVREAGLAETLTRSPALIEWAKDENNIEKRNRGLAELEHYRVAFRDKSSFFVIGGSGSYYFNDSDNGFHENQPRYTLDPANPRDGWYYKTAAMGPGCQLNVDHDDKLAVTKVWINCVMVEDGRVLGIAGTGIDLTTFIRDVVNTDQEGIETLFVDGSGAVQANRDQSRIDFHSLTNQTDSRKTVYQMVDDRQDRATLAGMLATVADAPDKVEARFLDVDGHQMLVGVGYLDRLGWYNITFMDVDKIIDRSLFAPIAALLALVMLAVAALMTFLFKRSVLDRLAGMEQAVAGVEAGDFSAAKPEGGSDEIGRLSVALTRMAAAVRDNTAVLEEAVRERTERLRRIAYLDPLTGIMNRRGFVDAFSTRADALPGGRLGVLLLDVDRFKNINDTRGHAAGDAVIVEVSRRLNAVVADSGLSARWGGDEFIVLLENCADETLTALSVRILDTMRSRPVPLPDETRMRITISIGAHLLAPAEELEVAALRADTALYAAKREGRNRMVRFDASRHGLSGSQVA